MLKRSSLISIVLLSLLMAGCAVELLAFDLILFFQVRFVDEGDFFRKLYFLGLEGVFGIPVTVGRHAAGVGYPGSCLYDITAELDIRETIGRRFGNVFCFGS